MNQGIFYKIRKALFWSMLVLFVIAGTVFVVYSFGYRLDIKEWKVVQTGGLNVKTTPKTTEIFLDDKKVNKKAGLFSNEIFLQSIIPGDHTLEVSKTGYFTWKKNIIIEPKMVVNFSNVLLMPENPLKENVFNATTSQEIIDVLPLGDGDEILLEMKTKSKTGVYQTLNIFNKSTAGLSEIFGRKINSSENLALIKNLVVDGTNYNHFLINYYSRSLGKQVYYLWEKSSPEEVTDFSKVLGQYFSSQPQKILFHPFEYNKFLVATSKKIGILDLDKKVVDYLPPVNPLDFNVGGNSLFWIDKVGGLYSYNLILKSTTPISILDEKELSLKEMTISPDAENILISLDNGKIILVKTDGSFHTIGEGISNVSFSPDNQKIAYLSGGSIKIYFMNDSIQDAVRKSGDVITIANKMGNVSELIWFKDSFHLLARSGEKFSFIELDDRDEVNIFDKIIDSGHYYWNNAGEVWRSASDSVEKINLLVGE
ncbi:MAG TPA: hypothetical protein PLQ44_02270 [Candidatus Paceibacterota bacterium]|nr:hypothetical protein [Candidatus Paceibacterota bacterium]HPT40404.1 hypothetical protein [Candidatus Paceibacterota bacterium]